MFFKIILASLSLAFLGSACAQTIDLNSDNRRADTYRRSDAMTEGSAVTCHVIQTRVVTMEVGNTAKIVSATAGGLAGVAAAQSRNSNSTALATLGGLFGAIGGNAIAEKVFADAATEIVMSCDGRPLVVVQQQDGTPQMPKGTEVFVIRNQGRTRVVPL